MQEWVTGLLSDPGWVGVLVTVVLGLLAIIVTVAVFKREQQRKELSYAVLGHQVLVGPDFDPGDRLQILYDGEPVRVIEALVVKLANTGNVPIRPDDYEEGLAIVFGAGTRVLAARLWHSHPYDIPALPLLPEAANRIQFEPLLLNPYDWFSITVVLGDFGGGPEVSARIAGVREIKMVEERGERWALPARMFGLPLGVFTALLIVVASPVGAIFLLTTLGASGAALGVWVLLVVALLCLVAVFRYISEPD